MPELPEVEILVRHLAPLLKNKTIRKSVVYRARVLRPTSINALQSTLQGAKFVALSRRGKYLLFTLRTGSAGDALTLLGHLGMTGRMYLSPTKTPLPKHAAVVLELGRHNFIFEDTRYFGRLTLDTTSVEKLGPEPLSEQFTQKHLVHRLRHSKQPIKVKLLDQSLVAGVGNIYASEALFRAGISPLTPAGKVSPAKLKKLRIAIRSVLSAAIRRGSTVPLNYYGSASRDRLFYFGRAADAEDFFEERLRVYDRAGRPCRRCKQPILRIIQAARSTFYCPQCQK
jgi:formamidopyrimidine-DNA glycosylase